MDSITHIVLGGCISEAVVGKRMGKRSLLVGMLAQSVPDIDFLASFWQDGAKQLLGHRGFTHSFLFGAIATVILVYVCKWYFRKRNISLALWFLLIGSNIFSHILLDSFNAYGTGWFEPFSHARISLHTIFVADPLFSIWPFMGFLLLAWMKMDHRHRKWVARASITLSMVYLLCTNFNKFLIEKDVAAAVKENKLTEEVHFTTASPFNSLLWFVVIKSGDGYYTGYHSVLDKDEKMELHFKPRNDSLLQLVKNQEEVTDLIRFSDGYYTVEKWNDTIVFNILRFGQVVGWHDPHEKFAFHYYLDRPGANDLVTQRGRFERWNRETLRSFLYRIKGN